jgi:DNA-binding beta-propeller fold protein YncE
MRHSLPSSLQRALGFVVVVAAASCRGTPGAATAEPGEPGRLEVILTADSAPSENVTFRVGTVNLEAPDGSIRTLFEGPTPPISSATLSTSPAVLGKAIVPPNLYRGLSLRIVDATRGDAVRTELTVRDEPAWARGSFRVRAGADTKVVLAIDFSRSFPTSSEFAPAVGMKGSQKRPRRALLFAALAGAPRVEALDREDGERIATVTTASVPGHILVSADRRRLLVTEPDADSIALVDLTSYAVVDRVRVPFGSRPKDVVVPAAGRFAFVACEGTNEIFVFDARSLGRVASFDAGRGPIRIDSDPFGERVYSISPVNRELRIFEARTPRALSRIPLDPDPTSIAFSRDGSRYFVGHRGGEAVLVFDRRTDALVGRAVIGPGTVDLATDPSSNRIYVLQDDPPRLAYLDPTSLALTRSVALPYGPVRAAVDPDDASLYVTLRDRSELLVVDRIGGNTRGTYPLDSAAADVVIVP